MSIPTRWMAVLLLLVSIAMYCFPESNVQPGFGVQTGIVQPKSDPQTLNKRVLSATRYKLTPGDAYELVVILDTTERYPLLLSDDYLLDVPYIGTLNVQGMHFAELKQLIVRRIKAKVPVQFVDFLLTSPALFDVFVYGGVKTPGIATVNPLSRVSDAVLLAGGLVEGASFRRLELLRGNDRRSFDLSRFAVEANLSENPLLEPEDRIYVPQADKIVEIIGRVKYPGAYELLPGEKLENLIAMAGGVTPDALSEKIRIRRIPPGGKAQQLEVALESAQGVELANLDRIAIGSSLENAPAITVEGAFYGEPIRPDKPALIPPDRILVNIPYVPDMTLLDVLDQLGGPTPLANLGRSYVQRAEGQRVPVKLQKLWESRSPQYDLALQAGDQVVVPMKVLKIFVAGEVNSPGAFPFASGLKVSDYVLAAGGINPDTGDPRRIFFVDELGGRQQVSLNGDVPKAGTLIYVGKNPWGTTQKTFTNILVVTGFIAAVLVFANNIIDFVVRF